MFSKKSIIVSYTLLAITYLSYTIYHLSKYKRFCFYYIFNRNDVGYHFLLEGFFQTNTTDKRLLEK